MRTENTNTDRLLSREAAADIVKKRFCKDVGANKVQQTVAGEKATSISRYDADSGRAASQQYAPSVNLVESGGVVPDNTLVCSDADGKAISAVNAAPDVFVLGRTTHGSSSSATGQDLSIEFFGEASYEAGSVVEDLQVASVHFTGAALHAAVQNWKNTTGSKIAVVKTQLLINTIATGAATGDVGTTVVSAITVSDNLLDGIDLHAAIGFKNLADQGGANGLATQELDNNGWVTVKEASGDATGGDFNLIVYYSLIP